jgi:hypothetical protein
MSLTRTTIIPANPVEAKKIHDFQVQQKNRTIMVIIGNTNTVEKAVDEADFLANEVNLKDFDRWVLWAKDHKIVKDTLELILAESGAERSNENFDNIKCFCLSPIRHEVSGIILKHGTLGPAKLDRSFISAEEYDVGLLNS